MGREWPRLKGQPDNLPRGSTDRGSRSVMTEMGAGSIRTGIGRDQGLSEL